MANRLHSRLSRIEQRRAVAVPNVVEVATGETDDEALARFIERHGRKPSSCIVVPIRATEDELADLEAMWAEQQRRLVTDARTATHKLKEATNGQRNAKLRTIRNATRSDGLHSVDRADDKPNSNGRQRRTVQRRPDSL